MSRAELCLTLSFDDDDDGLGKLFVTVKSGAFSGEGNAWFDPITVRETFVTPLRAFPLSETAPPMIEGGFWNKQKQKTLDQCHLRIVVSPYNKVGMLLVKVDLASEYSKTPDIDLQNTVTVRFLTEYAAIALFADDLDRVLDVSNREARQAVLSGAMT
jgi:hypothetical protein